MSTPNLLDGMENWMCFPASLALAIETPLKSILDAIGHDGSERVRPIAPPKCYRGFTIEEIQFAALNFGWIGSTYSDVVEGIVEGGMGILMDNTHIVNKVFSCCTCAILMCEYQSVFGPTLHAVAFRNKKVFNPSGGSKETIGKIRTIMTLSYLSGK